MVFALMLLGDTELVKTNWIFDVDAPDPRTILTNLDKYMENGTVENIAGRGAKRTVRTPEMIKRINDIISRNKATSVNSIAVQAGLSRSSAQRILHEEEYISYKVKSVTPLTQTHKIHRIMICKWFKRWNKYQDRIVWYSDECLFTLNPSGYEKNLRTWDKTNQHETIEKNIRKFHVQVWAAVSTEGNILWEFQSGIQTAKTYKQLLKRQLPKMNFELAYFQHDGASIHYSYKVRRFLQKHYKHHWIGRRCPEKRWPARSPDLSVCDYYLWNRIKGGLHKYEVKDEESLKKAIRKEISTITKEEIKFACNDLLRRVDMCLGTDGGRFEHLG